MARPSDIEGVQTNTLLTAHLSSLPRACVCYCSADPSRRRLDPACARAIKPPSFKGTRRQLVCASRRISHDPTPIPRLTTNSRKSGSCLPSFRLFRLPSTHHSMTPTNKLKSPVGAIRLPVFRIRSLSCVNRCLYCCASLAEPVPRGSLPVEVVIPALWLADRAGRGALCQASGGCLSS